MRPKSFTKPLAERHSRPHRSKRRAEHRVGRLPLPALRRTVEPEISVHSPRDIAVERVRAAGGPLDRASYSCECGYVFAAPVSTTVACPHCGADQAW
ncbi:MAG TPA: hypothetical protein VII53_05705 [Solirubrobacteraceae bacterium]